MNYIDFYKDLINNENFKNDLREIIHPIKLIIFENFYFFLYIFLFLLFINFLLHLGIILLLFKYLNKK